MSHDYASESRLFFSISSASDTSLSVTLSGGSQRKVSTPAGTVRSPLSMSALQSWSAGVIPVGRVMASLLIEKPNSNPLPLIPETSGWFHDSMAVRICYSRAATLAIKSEA